MRFRLRTLLIVLALGPAVLAGSYFAWHHRQQAQNRRMIQERLANLEKEVNPYVP